MIALLAFGLVVASLTFASLTKRKGGGGEWDLELIAYHDGILLTFEDHDSFSFSLTIGWARYVDVDLYVDSWCSLLNLRF